MATVRRVRAEDFAVQIAKDVEELRLRAVLAIQETARTGAKLCAANAPQAFGELADGMVVLRLAGGAVIRATAPHSAAVEVGSRPHMPPLAPLVRWVKLRGMQGLQQGRRAKGAARAVARMLQRQRTVEFEGVADEGGNVVLKKTNEYTSVDAAEQVAWMIAGAIKKRGTRPTWFMKRTLPEIKAVLGANLRDWLSRPL